MPAEVGEDLPEPAPEPRERPEGVGAGLGREVPDTARDCTGGDR